MLSCLLKCKEAPLCKLCFKQPGLVLYDQVLLCNVTPVLFPSLCPAVHTEPAPSPLNSKLIKVSVIIYISVPYTYGSVVGLLLYFSS